MDLNVADWCGLNQCDAMQSSERGKMIKGENCEGKWTVGFFLVSLL